MSTDQLLHGCKCLCYLRHVQYLYDIASYLAAFRHEGHEFQKRNGYDDFEDDSNVAKSVLTNQTVDPIHYFDKDGYSHAIEKLRLFLPIWQTSVSAPEACCV